MSAPEFSRRVRAHDVGAAARVEALAADAAERERLAARFDLLALDRLEAALALRREAAGVRVTGRVAGAATQACAVSGEPVPAAIDEPVDLLFAPELATPAPDEEIELSADDCDVVPMEGDAIDLGEVVAQTLGLALDPFPRADAATLAAARTRLLDEVEAARLAAADKAAASPFAVLKRG